MPNKIKVLVVGDIVGKGARNAFIHYLPTLKEKYNYDLIIINAENTTHGRGLNYNHYKIYDNLKISAMTMGNHVLDDKEIYNYIDKTSNLVVPGNVIYDNKIFDNHKEINIDFHGYNIKIINLLGKFNHTEKFDIIDPLKYFDDIYNADSNSIYIVDYHAELTLEKNLLAYYLDGRASLIYGTHTHVQTADERILPKKSAFITDVGMCGSKDSIIGYDYQSFIDKLTKKTSTFVSKLEPFILNALFAEIDLETKEVLSIIRINEKMS